MGKSRWIKKNWLAWSHWWGQGWWAEENLSLPGLHGRVVGHVASLCTGKELFVHKVSARLSRVSQHSSKLHPFKDGFTNTKELKVPCSARQGSMLAQNPGILFYSHFKPLAHTHVYSFFKASHKMNINWLLHDPPWGICLISLASKIRQTIWVEYAVRSFNITNMIV